MDNYKICKKCGNQSLGERKGEFVDFDADLNRHGTKGIPLCSDCLGTGFILLDFKPLSKQVKLLRKENFTIQMRMSETAKQLKDNKKTNNATQQIAIDKALLKKNNKKLKAISLKALSILAKKNISPFVGSLAINIKIKNGEE